MSFARRGSLLPIAAVAVLIAMAPPTSAVPGRAHPGALDQAFGDHGTVVLPFQAKSVAVAAARLADGKFLVVGSRGEDMLLMRFNPDGHLDHSFSDDGVVTTTFPHKLARALAVAVVPGGKMVVGGFVQKPGDPFNQEDIAVARYLANGEPDESFSDDGRVVTDVRGTDDVFDGMTVGPDGKPVVADQVYKRAGVFQSTVIRYTTGGELDPAFDGDGMAVLPHQQHPSLAAVVPRPGGGYLLAGQVQGTGARSIDMAVFAVTGGGEVDTTFGNNGRVVVDFDHTYDAGYSVLVDPDHRIVVGGASAADFAVARFTSGGHLDHSFSGDGKATVRLGTDIDSVYSSAFDGGRIVIGGLTRSSSGDDRWGLARFDADGSLDTGFGSNGRVITSFTPGTAARDELYGLVVLPAEDRIVGVGSTGAKAALAAYMS